MKIRESNPPDIGLIQFLFFNTDARYWFLVKCGNSAFWDSKDSLLAKFFKFTIMSTFTDNLLDLLAPLGNVSAHKMFGGYGIYKDD